MLKRRRGDVIYGARAASGVIIITTKKGRRNQATRVNVSASLFVTDRPNLDKLNLMNASQKVDLELALAANGRLNYLSGMGGVARILDQAGERAALVGGGFSALSPKRSRRSMPCAKTAPTGARRFTRWRSTSSTASASRAAATRPATISRAATTMNRERPSARDSSV